MEGRIGNVVFDAPAAVSLEHYGQVAGAIAEMYAQLLGMRRQSRAEMHREAGYPISEGDELDPLVRPHREGGLGFAFEFQTEGYEPPRWPDPAYPQQMHLDISASDLDGAESLVLGLGATKLAEEDDHRTYADPGGHPFCLYDDLSRGDSAPGQLARVVFDCFSPRSLASFYAEFLGMPKRIEDSPVRVVISFEDEGLPMLAFQHVVCTQPRWPDPRYPEQLHLDIGFDDGEAACERAEQLGAIRLPTAPGGAVVYADPGGHPFCL